MNHKALFYIALLLVSFLTVLPIPFVQGFSGSNGEFGNWSWNAGTKDMTIIPNATANAGDNETNGYQFQDIVNAIVLNGWSAEYNVSGTGNQFEFYFQIIEGDGGNVTWFVDTYKQVKFVPQGNGRKIFHVKNNATLRLGVLEDEANRVTSQGVSLFVADSAYNSMYLLYGDSGSVIRLYGCQLYNSHDRFPPPPLCYVFLSGKWDTVSRIYATIIDRILAINIENTEIYDVIFTHYTWSTSFQLGLRGNNTVDGLSMFGDAYAFYHIGTTQFVVENAYVRNMTNLVRCYDSYNEWDTFFHANLTNIDSDNWGIVWVSNWGTENVNIYREYEFDLNVTDTGGNPLENATVTVSYYGGSGGESFTVSTGSNGSFSTKTLTMGYYDKDGGNALYNYNPFNIEVSCENHTTQNFNFTLDEKLVWVLSLESSSGGFTSGFGMGFILTLFVAVIFAVALVGYKTRKH